MNNHVNPVFAGILAQFEPIPVGKVAPAPTRIPAPTPSLELLYAAQDEMGDHAVATAAARECLTDEEVEAITDAADTDMTGTDELEDVKHDLREAWDAALHGQHQLTPVTLPMFDDAGKLVFVTFRVLLAKLMELQWAIQLLSDAVRTDNTQRLQVFLRQNYVDGCCQRLADAGWRL